MASAATSICWACAKGAIKKVRLISAAITAARAGLKGLMNMQAS